MQAECRLTLGPHTLSTYKTLRVRVRMISYVDNYYSLGKLRMVNSGLLGYFSYRDSGLLCKDKKVMDFIVSVDRDAAATISFEIK